jgi:hypothetical protein
VTWTLFFQIAMLMTLGIVALSALIDSAIKTWRGQQ